MPNPYFRFKQFTVYHDRCAMKVTTDSCLFGAWCAHLLQGTTAPGDHLLDIGTGTGLLSLMVAQENNLPIDAVEIDPEAALQAGANIAASPWRDRIHVWEANILEWEKEKGYSVIISNPPFYENELAAPNEKKARAHHSTALAADDLLSKINNLLKEDGRFFLLYPFKRLEEITGKLQAEGLFLHSIVGQRQTPDHPPFRVMLQGGRVKAPKVNTGEIVIREGAGYTKAFTDLLSAYYLYL